MASTTPSPKLGKSQALNIAQTTTARLATIVPAIATELSPVTIYQPNADGGAGNELSVNTILPVDWNDAYGVWVAPDVNGDGSDYYVQVECFGAGGGGGGGNATQGGAGGGGGEYACEDRYPITPGNSYSYTVGLPGSGGLNNGNGNINPGSAGTAGGDTVFDIAGLGMAGGVVAHGGGGGDTTSIGIGGTGGTGSSNSIHFDGGDGGTNNSAFGSDNPISLSQASGMFVGNTLDQSIIPTWWILNDATHTGGVLNDSTLNGHNGVLSNWVTGGYGLASDSGSFTSPTQVPAYATQAGQGGWSGLGPNATVNGYIGRILIDALTKPSSSIAANEAFAYSGSKLTLSCWIRCEPGGQFGNTAAGSYAVIATNTQGYSGNSMKGYALFLVNEGTAASPSWTLFGAVGNGTSRTLTAHSIGTPVPGDWLYVVMTYNSGTLTLYVNGTSVQTATSSGYTSVPGGGYTHTVGKDPKAQSNWYFGAIGNIWWANDCATSALVSQAYGLSPGTGGAGGGASGGPSANGGDGASASGATGGNGGTPATIPASLEDTATMAQGGYAGANGGSGNPDPNPPAQGEFGGGGGGSGDMGSPPNIQIVTVDFTSAAAYNGVDAASNPGAVYNSAQQVNPATGLNSVLYAGGQASDAATGSKNSLLLLPAGITETFGSGNWTINNIFLTFTNAYPQNTTQTILEVGYTTDTVLPQTYNGDSLQAYTGAITIPVGADTITYDLAPGGLAAAIENGTATALMIGPGNEVAFDAYNAPTGAQFYCAIYGPGAADTSGNSQAPYLTFVLEETTTVQPGSPGSGGAIEITYLDNSYYPIAFAAPYAGYDQPANTGNEFAEGFTGNITAWDPESQINFDPDTDNYVFPETWHEMNSFNTGYSHDALTPMYKLNADNTVSFAGGVDCGTNATTSEVCAAFTGVGFYNPLSNKRFLCPTNLTGTPYVELTVETTGELLISAGPSVGTAYNFYLDNVRFPLDY